MKKVLLTVFALALFSISSVVKAQTAEEMKESKSRYEKLEKLAAKGAPDATGLSNIDGLSVKSVGVMNESLQITPLLENLYYRSLGESNDGVIDVTVKKPTLDECIELSARITKLATDAKSASENIEGATSDLQKASITQKMKAGKSLDFSKNVLSIVGTESVFQVKAIGEIIKTVKSADSL